jgi:hypothetical protein
MKVNPDARQKGIRTSNVKIIAARDEGVSPGLKNTRDRMSINIREIIGLTEKTRFIFLMSFSVDLPAKEDPTADPISHDPKKEPVMSSYPQVTFIISRISRN